MTMSQYCHVDVLRSGLLCGISSLGQIGKSTVELQYVVFQWRVMQILRHATSTSFQKTSRFE